MAKSYFKNADGCIVVYDVTNRLSYRSVSYWLEEFTAKSKALDSSIPLLPVLVLGNKIDLKQELKQVSFDELTRFGNENRVLFEEVSAKSNKNQGVHSSINKLVDLIVSMSNSVIERRFSFV